MSIRKDNYKNLITEEWFNSLPNEWKDYWLENVDCSTFDILSKSIFNTKKIEIANNKNLTNVKGLKYCVNLEYLDLVCCSLNCIKDLRNCYKLKTIHFEFNDLRTLEGLENCFYLKEFSCSNNPIISLKGIQNCYNLERLWCHHSNFLTWTNYSNCYYIQMCEKLKLLHIDYYLINIYNVNPFIKSFIRKIDNVY